MPEATTKKKTLKKVESKVGNKTVKKPVTKKATARLENRIAPVPAMQAYHNYVSRTISGTKSEFDIFDEAHKANDNVLIEGPTGTGKTSAIVAWAAKNNKPFYAIPSNVGIEPSQLFGKFIPDGLGGFVWQDGPVTDVVRYGGVLLFNEVNFMPDRVSTVVFGLLDGRRSISLLDHMAEVIHAHDDLLIVADMNPDYQGTRPLNAAFRNRFVHQLVWDYDPAIEKKLVLSSTLLELVTNIRKQIANDMIQTPVSTNMMLEFERIAKSISIEYAASNFINHFHADERGPIQTSLNAVMRNFERDYAPKVAVEPRVTAPDPDSSSVAPDGGPINWLNTYN